MLKILCIFVLFAVTLAIQLGADESPDDRRIIGGDVSLPGQYPHHVSLRANNGTLHFCGGSIVGRRFILTAAHCTQRRYSNPQNVRIIAGAIRLNGADGVQYALDRIVNHPNFNQSTLANDIAVLRTARTIWWTSLVRPIYLPTSDLPAEGGMPVTVSGWGQFRPGQPTPNNRPAILQWLNTETLNRPECIRRLAQNGRFVRENMLCTSNRRNTGVCRGDSGSPLQTQGLTEVLIGIVSWRIGCASGFPDVYTRIHPHLQFIRRNIQV